MEVNPQNTATIHNYHLLADNTSNAVLVNYGDLLEEHESFADDGPQTFTLIKDPEAPGGNSVVLEKTSEDDWNTCVQLDCAMSRYEGTIIFKVEGGPDEHDQPSEKFVTVL